MAAPLPENPVIVSVLHAGVLVPVEFADRLPRVDTLAEIDLFSHLLYEQLPATQVEPYVSRSSYIDTVGHI